MASRGQQIADEYLSGDGGDPTGQLALESPPAGWRQPSWRTLLKRIAAVDTDEARMLYAVALRRRGRQPTDPRLALWALHMRSTYRPHEVGALVISTRDGKDLKDVLKYSREMLEREARRYVAIAKKYPGSATVRLPRHAAEPVRARRRTAKRNG